MKALYLICCCVALGLVSMSCDSSPQISTIDPPTELLPGRHIRALQSSNITRRYFLYVPEGLDLDSDNVSLILAFHGGFDTAENFANVIRLHQDAGPAGYLVAYPEGHVRSWNAGTCCGRAFDEGIDDVAFVEAIINDIGAEVNLDRRRVFATGFSNGSMMTYRLACQLSDRIAAVAPAGAAPVLPENLCTPPRPVAVLHFHGLSDEWGPFEGGIGVYEPPGEQRSIPETMDFWLNHNQCTDETRETYNQGGARCITHPSCSQSTEVALCTIDDLGHQWPGSEAVLPSVFGPGSSDLPANNVLIDFFNNHPR